MYLELGQEQQNICILHGVTAGSIHGKVASGAFQQSNCPECSVPFILRRSAAASKDDMNEVQQAVWSVTLTAGSHPDQCIAHYSVGPSAHKLLLETLRLVLPC